MNPPTVSGRHRYRVSRFSELLQSYWLFLQIVCSMERVRFFSNEVDVGILLVVETIPGKFHQNRLHGVETYSEQTGRQRLIFI